MRLRCIAAAALAVAWSSPVLAQGTYVAVSLTGDIVRLSRSETRGVRDSSTGGEAIGFALRAGTPLGSNWGVEAEFARPSAIDNEGAPDILPLAYRNLGAAVSSDGVGAFTTPSPGLVIYPPLSYRVRTSQRNTTFSAAIWARHAVSARAALVYSGGVGFHRTGRDAEFSYGPARDVAGPIIVPPPMATESIVYSTRPFAGVDARVRMTDHVDFVPGVRLHGLEGGVLVRPGLGLAWTF